jgi:hypothetical protein
MFRQSTITVVNVLNTDEPDHCSDVAYANDDIGVFELRGGLVTNWRD